MRDVAKLVGELIDLLSIEAYGVRGVLSGERLLLIGLREGNINAYTFDGSELIKLNGEPISGVALAKYDSDRVLVYRDVGRGREQELIYVVDPERPGEEEPLPGMKPARLMGVAYEGETIAFSASDMEGNHIYLHRGGRTEKVLTYPGLPSLTDLSGNLAVGIDLFGQSRGKFDLFYLDLDAKEFKKHSDPEGSVTSAIFSRDGSIIYSVEGASEAKLKVLNPETGEVSELALPHDELREFRPVAFNLVTLTRDGRVIAVARKEGRSEIFVDGKRVEAPPGIHGLVVEWRGELVASHTSLNTPSRILKLSGEVLISGSLPEFVSEALGRSYAVRVRSFDGEKVPTLVLESKRAEKPGPTVVLVHGGPFSEYSDSWNIFASSMALLGFHVIMPNYRGSTGYGEDWRLKLVGDPCGGELEDITKVAEWAKESGLANRLYIIGYSYGGYMVMCSLTKKPGLYRAGVAGASIVDWEMMYELSDAAFKGFIDMVFGGRRELWKERSPINYVDGLRDPLCIIHPQNDSRTPLKPVLKFMELALERGKSFEAHIAPDMGHAVNKVEDMIKLVLPAALFLIRMEEKDDY